MSNKKTQANKSNKNIFIIIGILAVLIIGFLVLKAAPGEESAAASGSDLIIPKGEISETAKFYPYTAGKTKMEVMAVKASDGSIRTAFNTCQVCFDSGRGYYKQQGDVVICQNCGNRFKLDQIEKIKGGCNPVPITSENKIEDDSNIKISKEFLEQNKELFGNWKKQ